MKNIQRGFIIFLVIIIAGAVFVAMRKDGANVIVNEKENVPLTSTDEWKTLSYVGTEFSYSLKYPSSDEYKVVNVLDRESALKQLDIVDASGKTKCSVYLTMPSYTVSAVKEQGIDIVYQKALTKTRKTLTDIKEIYSEEPERQIGKLTGVMFMGKLTDNSSRNLFVAKYPEKNMVGSFELGCRDFVEDAVFAVYQKDFGGIIKSFK